MKLNNKGFVISTLMYALLIVFLFLLIGIITLLSNRKSILDRLKKDVKNEINGMVKNDYYPNGTAIYFNPVTNKTCSDYDDENSINETKTGCMKWYAFNDSVNSNKVNLILDHNTTYKTDYNSAEINYEPREAKEELDALIYGSKWKSKPRLISADEIAHIVGADRDDTIKWSSSKEYGTDDTSTESSWLYLDGGRNSDPTVYESGNNGWQKQYANSSTPSNYAWLFDYTTGCKSYGCSEEDSSTYGYWTSSPVSDYSSRAWGVSNCGILDYYDVGFDDYFGVRPVITVDKKNIYKQYKDDKLNGADPVLKKDMIPVTISNDGTVKKADIKDEWYNYTNKEWANAVVLVDNSKYNAGEEIPEAKIKAYYVWIPRFRYQLFDNTTESEINIAFESAYTNKSLSTTVGEYLTHPAFTYGNEELSGFWVGKFETTGTQSSPSIKPYTSTTNSDITSLRSLNVSTQYNTAGSVSSNSTMMKNDEWGAVAYLSHSKYGLNGKVRINNDNRYHTGCGADTDGKSAAASCDIEYGKVTEYPQSTTGNITGIFDMSGGAWEYMMAVRADSNGKPLSGRHNLYNSGFNGKFGCPTCDSSTSGVDSSILELTTGTNYPESKEYNLYDNPSNRNRITETNGCNGSACYGHAMNEIRKASGGTGAWYSEYSSFVSTGGPFVLRGGNYSRGASAGVFVFANGSGYAYSYDSFRVVVR